MPETPKSPTVASAEDVTHDVGEETSEPEVEGMGPRPVKVQHPPMEVCRLFDPG
jgi:hypothetical protein